MIALWILLAGAGFAVIAGMRTPFLFLARLCLLIEAALQVAREQTMQAAEAWARGVMPRFEAIRKAEARLE